MAPSPELIHYYALYKFFISSSAQTIVVFFLKMYNTVLKIIFFVGVQRIQKKRYFTQ